MKTNSARKIKENKAPVQKPAKKAKMKNPSRKRATFLGNIKIAPKLLAAFLITALLSTAMGVYAVFSLKTLNASAKQTYVNVLLPTQNLTSVIESFDKERLALRQALINEDELYTAVYISIINNADRSLVSQLTLIESLLPDESVEMFNTLQAEYAIYQEQMSIAIASLEAGDKESVRKELVDGTLRDTENTVEASIDDLIYSVTGKAASTSVLNDRTANTVFTITLCAVGFVLLFSIVIGILISRSISKPIRKLTEGAKRLAAGEIDFQITDAPTKDEVGQIREAFQKILAVIRDMTQDTDMLITASAMGELSVRADADKHTGAYRKIVDGFNATLDSAVTPMVESAKALTELASGNLNVSVDGEFNGDFAIVKNAFNNTVESLKTYIGEIISVMENVASGRLDVTIESEFKGDFKAIKDSINQSVVAFSGVLKDINSASDEVALGTQQLSSGSQTISQGATEQASALEELTASLSEIARETAHNAEKAGKANEISQKAKDFALSGNEKMKLLQAAMEEINESSSNISKIIKVIDGIAFQTNILSLNAAVEAARAGVHGKGFAVVADEVRNLAARSANAARETTDLIENSMGKTMAGTKIADETAKALLEIVGQVEKTVELSGEIATASTGQAAGIDQIGRGIEQLSAVVQTNSATAEEAAASAEQLSAQAEYLKNMVGKFVLYGEDAPETAEPRALTDGYGGASYEAALLNDKDFGKY